MDIPLLIIIEIQWLLIVIKIFTKTKEKIKVIKNDKLIIKMINKKWEKMDSNLVSLRKTKLPTYPEGNKTHVDLVIPFICSCLLFSNMHNHIFVNFMIFLLVQCLCCLSS